jgi:hypothetical protein
MEASALDEALHAEADVLIYEKGLDEILKQHGIPHYTGSYSLRLMTWRDLDIYLDTNNISIAKFFDLGAAIGAKLNPVKMSFRNERIGRTEGLPPGLYWGIYLGDERKGAWKIDIWAMEHDECMERLQYCDELGKKISGEARKYILDIKSKCWQDPAYRKLYSSKDIYTAVLDKGVTNIEAFRKYLAFT